MKVAQLQGTPWHSEQMRKGCNDGSKYCIFNHKICSCESNTKYYHKTCVGKGKCLWFETRTGTPKVYSTKVYTLKSTQEKGVKHMNSANENKTKESKSDKFLRLSKTRVDKIEEAIRKAFAI